MGFRNKYKYKKMIKKYLEILICLIKLKDKILIDVSPYSQFNVNCPEARQVIFSTQWKPPCACMSENACTQWASFGSRITWPASI